MSFNHTNIANVNIKMKNGTWNPETHSILLEYDANAAARFAVKMIPVVAEKITDFTEAQAILNKFRIAK